MSNWHPLDRLKQTLIARIPGTTEGMLDLEIINVVDQFYRRTNAWRWYTEFDLEEGETNYDFIAPPENATLVRVMWIRQRDTSYLPAETVDDSDTATGVTGRGRITADRSTAAQEVIYEPDRTVGTGAALRYAIFFPQYISVTLPVTQQALQYPIQTELALTVNVEHCCVDGCTSIEVPDWHYSHFFEAWLYGVQASMMSQIAKPYTNMDMAKVYTRSFRERVSFHKQESNRGRVYDRPMWRYPRGGFITT
jgi:hypothetical protein